MNQLKLKFSKIKNNQFVRFLLIGGFCALQNIFWLYLLTSVLRIHYIISTIILMFIINTLGFYLNRKYTFKFQKSKNNFWQALFRYYTVILASSCAVLLLMYTLVDLLKIWYLYAHILITVLMTLYNFLIHKKWTFK